MSTANLPHRFELPKGTPPELIAMIEATARDAFNQYGAAAFEMSREAALAHEAGHTIVMAHEGVTVQSVRIFSRSIPIFGTVWGGWCAVDNGEGWPVGPDTSAEHDISVARITIGGLAGEACYGLDKPASSLDELAVSQMIGMMVAKKLADHELTSAEEQREYAEPLWHERVWDVAVKIIRNNHAPFMRLVEHLYLYERINGSKLRSVLKQVRRIAA